MAQKRFIATNGLDANSKSIINVTDPTNAQDAATKNSASNASNLTTGTVDPARIAAVIAAGASGLMTGSDKTKLDGIATGATANAGTVTTVSVVSANGLAGTVDTATSTPAITLSTTITGILKGNATAIAAATEGTDYSVGTSALATGIVKSTTSTGALSIAAAGTDYIAPYGSTTANTVLAAPDGSAGTPTFRALVAADIPSLAWSKITSGLPTTLSGYGITNAYTKTETDTLLQGLDPKQSVKIATTAALTLASGFANGAVIDGYTLVTGDRILIKDQAAPAENGIYTVNASGAPTRAVDMDAWTEVPNAYVFVEQGTVNADKGFVCTSNITGALGTDAINWVLFTSAGAYTASTGLTLTSGAFSITNTAVTPNPYGSASKVGTFTVNQQGQLTAASDVNISIASTAVTGLATSATTDTTNADNISSGTLLAARMPALTGDVTTVAGAVATTLATQAGVTASSVSGSATSITPFTVNEKGIITATGTAVTIAPTFANVASKPTTVSGYGITDALTTGANTSVILTNGTVTSGTLVTTTAVSQTLDTVVAATYRSMSYKIQATAGTDFHYTNIDVIHDDSGNAYVSQYGDIITGASLITAIDSAIVTTNWNVTINPVNAATTIKWIKTMINS